MKSQSTFNLIPWKDTPRKSLKIKKVNVGQLITSRGLIDVLAPCSPFTGTSGTCRELGKRFLIQVWVVRVQTPSIQRQRFHIKVPLVLLRTRQTFSLDPIDNPFDKESDS